MAVHAHIQYFSGDLVRIIYEASAIVLAVRQYSEGETSTVSGNAVTGKGVHASERPCFSSYP